MFSLQPADFELAPAAIIVLIVVAAMLQDDLTCATVGLLASDETLPLPIAWSACFAGTLLGDLTWYTLARCFGPGLVAHAPLKWVLKPRLLDRATAVIDRYGAWSIFLCRFLPGLRTYLQIVIGTLHRDTARAVSVFAIAACLYTLLVVGFCHVFRNSLGVFGLYEKYGTAAMLLTVAAVVAALWLGKRVVRSLTLPRPGNDQE